MLEKNDGQLIEQYLRGDKESLEILIQRYLRIIYAFVYRQLRSQPEAEEITQEIFLKVWKNLKKFDQQKSFKTWIFVIARNTTLDWFKKKKALPFSNFDEKDGSNIITDSLTDPNLLPNELLEESEISDRLTTAKEKISAPYREVVSLHYDKHYNLREIAEKLNEPLPTIKSRHRRALIALKQILSERL